MAALGPGKSSGTMGLPLSLEILEGGVDGLAGAGGGVGVLPAGVHLGLPVDMRT